MRQRSLGDVATSTEPTTASAPSNAVHLASPAPCGASLGRDAFSDAR
jgi:hypothetical protein